MSKTIKINYNIIGDIVPKEERNPKLYYYELREYDNGNGFEIERSVLVNFYGTLVTDREILGDLEYIDYKKIFESEEINMYQTDFC